MLILVFANIQIINENNKICYPHYLTFCNTNVEPYLYDLLANRHLKMFLNLLVYKFS